jgi:hypothetical protein
MVTIFILVLLPINWVVVVSAGGTSADRDSILACAPLSVRACVCAKQLRNVCAASAAGTLDYLDAPLLRKHLALRNLTSRLISYSLAPAILLWFSPARWHVCKVCMARFRAMWH